MDRILAGQLERLQTDHIDCYLMHGMAATTWAKLVDLGALEFMDAAKADGRIRYAGFSYHDDPPAFVPIVDAYDWDFCQIQYNFLDIAHQAGAAGLAYAADRGLGVIVMEPLKGGRLAPPVPESIQRLWDSHAVQHSPVEWALRFVWDDARVCSLLSGMSTMEQVVVNTALAEAEEAGSLTAADRVLIDKVREAYRDRTVVDCTACRYCLPCPQGIDIPMIFSSVNSVSLFEDLEGERAGYNIGIELKHTARASECSECGQCEGACPQHIEVIKEMAGAARMFD
jgi:uncharacterized protein